MLTASSGLRLRPRGWSEPRDLRTEPGLSPSSVSPGAPILLPTTATTGKSSGFWGPAGLEPWMHAPRELETAAPAGKAPAAGSRPRPPPPRPRALLPTPLSPARPPWRHGALHFLPSWLLLLPRTRRGPECIGGFGWKGQGIRLNKNLPRTVKEPRRTDRSVCPGHLKVQVFLLFGDTTWE